MAIINCSNCGGVVSTKASACPHCATTVFKSAENKEDKIEALADELGSLSAAISAEYDKQPAPVTPAPATSAQDGTQTSGYSMGGFWLFYFIVVSVVWYNFDVRFAARVAAALGIILAYLDQTRPPHSATPQAQAPTIGDDPK